MNIFTASYGGTTQVVILLRGYLHQILTELIKDGNFMFTGIHLKGFLVIPMFENLKAQDHNFDKSRKVKIPKGSGLEGQEGLDCARK